MNFPDTLGTMENLATTLAYEKRANEAISLYEKAVENSAKAERPLQIQARYTYAGGLCILGRPDDAMRKLQDAVKLGFRNADQLAAEEDLKSLRNDPRFQSLLAEMRKQPAGAATKNAQ